MKVIIDNVYSTIEGADETLLNMIDEELSVKQPGYFFNPAYKMGRWDGKIRFYDKKSRTFPTGHLEKVLEILETAEVEDVRKPYDIDVPDEIQLLEPDAEGGVITLRDYQYDAVKGAVSGFRGVVNVATNGGKTEIASGIIKQLLPHLEGEDTILFVTHSKEIFHQSAARIEKRLNIKVGKVGDGAWDVKPVTLIMIPTISKYIKKPTKDTISYTGEMKSVRLLVRLLDGELAKGLNNRRIMQDALAALEGVDEEKDYDEKAIEIVSHILQTQKDSDGCLKEFQKMKKDLAKYQEKKIKEAMKKHEDVLQFLSTAKAFIGDEVHHASSTTWYDTLMLCTNAVYRVGLTGTVDKKDPVNVMRLFGAVGGIITKISNDFLIKRGISAKPTMFLETIKVPDLSNSLSWQNAYKLGIVENEVRNQSIVDKVAEKYVEGKGCLIIVNYTAHGDKLKEMLDKVGVECEFTHGGRTSEDRLNILNDMKNERLKVLIATSVLDEGVDISGINCLWLAAGGKSFRQVLQRIGRGLRKKADGSGLEVYDFLDLNNKHLSEHTMERYQYYKDENFEIKKV
ncbi:type III restriction enzyme, res subunit [Lysinibacillus phage vB_LfM_LysYB1]|nr:type III restriction enzyme, res subunit [Lysinibacillus phage vB_LfM_LysYB1]WAB25233.1 type III restriction enzyme, res subunit [Lysinibacillus phage vB_LfM_LysYB2]